MGGLILKKIALRWLPALFFFITLFPGSAGAVAVSWMGTGAPDSNRFEVDDKGGNSVEGHHFMFNGLDHTFLSYLLVSDGTGVDFAESAADFTGSGVSLFSGPFSFASLVDQIVSKKLDTFTPVTMVLKNSRFKIEETVYIKNDKDYVIVELRGVNQAAEALPLFIAMVNDWDVGEATNDNDGIGIDTARSLLYQQEDEGPEDYTIGIASLVNPIDQYRLGGSGLDYLLPNGTLAVLADNYTLHRHFLNNTKPIEECDNDVGNIVSDGCTPKCHLPAGGQVCGNGVIEGDEECDDANPVDGDGCDSTCLREGIDCGNGILDGGEECDDGDRDTGDGCDFDCKVEFYATGNEGWCGDGAINNGGTGRQEIQASFVKDMATALSVKFADVPAGRGATAAFCLIGAKGSDLAASLTDLQSKADDCLAFYKANIAKCGNGIQNAGEECDGEVGCNLECPSAGGSENNGNNEGGSGNNTTGAGETGTGNSGAVENTQPSTGETTGEGEGEGASGSESSKASGTTACSCSLERPRPPLSAFLPEMFFAGIFLVHYIVARRNRGVCGKRSFLWGGGL